MGRELRRKQAKRDGKNVREVQKKIKDKPLSPKSFMIIMVFIVIFFAVLYLLTDMFITNKNKWFGNNDEENTVELKNKILAADSLKQTEEEYYVYYYDTTDESVEVANALYSIKEKIYRVDLNDGFNSNFVGEPSGIVENIEDLKVSNPTLIKISSEKIVAFYNGTEEITSALK